MNIEQQIETAMRAELEKAIEEEVTNAQQRIRDRISEIAAKVPLRVIRDNNLAENQAVYSVIVDHREEAKQA